MVIMNLIFGFQQNTDPRAMYIGNLKEPETNSGTEFKFNILSIPNNSKMVDTLQISDSLALCL